MFPFYQDGTLELTVKTGGVAGVHITISMIIPGSLLKAPLMCVPNATLEIATLYANLGGGQASTWWRAPRRSRTRWLQPAADFKLNVALNAIGNWQAVCLGCARMEDGV